jgi:hypothetical protein
MLSNRVRSCFFGAHRRTLPHNKSAATAGFYRTRGLLSWAFEGVGTGGGGLPIHDGIQARGCAGFVKTSYRQAPSHDETGVSDSAVSTHTFVSDRYVGANRFEGVVTAGD